MSKGYCPNDTALCSYAQNKTVLEIKPGKDKCPECNKKIQEIPDVKPPVVKWGGIAGVALAIILIIFLWRSCGSNVKNTSKGANTITAELTEDDFLISTEKIIAEKLEIIQRLKAEKKYDKKLIDSLEREVQDLSETYVKVKDAFENSTPQNRAKAAKAIAELNQRTTNFGVQIDSIATKIGRAKYDSLQASITKINPEFAISLKEKDEQIAQLNRKVRNLEDQNRSNNSNSDEVRRLKDEIARLKDEIVRLNNEKSALTNQLAQSRDSVKLLLLEKESGSTNAIAEADSLRKKIEQQKVDVQKLKVLEAERERVKNIAGSFDVFYLDKKGRQIKLDASARSRDIKEMVINFTSITVEDGPVVIKFEGVQGTVTPQSLEQNSTLNSGKMQSITIPAKGLLPKGNYYVRIYKNGNEIASKFFEVYGIF